MGLPIFTENDDITGGSLREAVMQLNARLRSLENQLYNILTSLDSSNFAEINLDDITLKSENGSVIGGDMIRLSGGGESLEIGYDRMAKKFVCRLPSGTQAGGLNAVTLNVDTITARSLHVSCGGEGSFDVGYDTSTKEFRFKLVNKNGTTKFSY